MLQKVITQDATDEGLWLKRINEYLKAFLFSQQEVMAIRIVADKVDARIAQMELFRQSK